MIDKTNKENEEAEDAKFMKKVKTAVRTMNKNAKDHADHMAVMINEMIEKREFTPAQSPFAVYLFASELISRMSSVSEEDQLERVEQLLNAAKETRHILN